MDGTNKMIAIELAYRTATLTSPHIDIVVLLSRLPFDRVLELMLVMRQAGYVRSPKNFLTRAIKENWKPEGMPERVR